MTLSRRSENVNILGGGPKTRNDTKRVIRGHVVRLNNNCILCVYRHSRFRKFVGAAQL
jgi:hypothetical protein